MAKRKHELEKIVEAPARTLDDSIKAGRAALSVVERKPAARRAARFWKLLGPGLVTGAADDDPSGIATYSQAGAAYGNQFLWLMSFTYPLMAVVQEMCARIGLVTGRGLASNIKARYPRWVLYFCTLLLFAANSFNIGVDLGAMAETVRLVVPAAGFTLLVIALTLLSLGLQIFMPYRRYASYLKWLSLVLFSYVASSLLAGLDWRRVLEHAILPQLPAGRDALILVCGILGTTISPYLFFWETSQEVEEEILAGKTTLEKRRNATGDEVARMRVDNWFGMGVSNLVAFFIIAACAATLASHGITDIRSAGEAALALEPFAGKFAELLFALGIIGAGLLAVPVLAGSASYALSESFGWKEGLYRKLRAAGAFYGIIIISMVVGLLVNFLGLDPIKALIYSAVLNGLISPVILAIIVHLASDVSLMGRHASGRVTAGVGWLTTFLMAAVGVATIVVFFR